MNPKIFFSIGVLAGIVALGVIAWRWAEEGLRAREATAKVEAKQRVLRAERERREARLAATDQEQEAAKTALDALKKLAPAVASAKPPSAPPRRSLSILEMIRNAPEVEAYYLEYQREKLTAVYGPLFRTLGLPPEMVARFQDNYVRREEARMDLENVLGTQGPDSAAAVEKLRASAEADYREAQRALLGAPGYAQLQDYENVAWWRSTVSAMAGVAAVEHVAFSAAQADALVEALHASNSGRNGVDWTAFDARAGGILSPEQFKVIHTMDPGPTRAGLLQSRLYDLVEKAKREEEKQAVPAGAIATKPKG